VIGHLDRPIDDPQVGELARRPGGGVGPTVVVHIDTDADP
jgi:hypothetical protein